MEQNTQQEPAKGRNLFAQASQGRNLFAQQPEPIENNQPGVAKHVGSQVARGAVRTIANVPRAAALKAFGPDRDLLKEYKLIRAGALDELKKPPGERQFDQKDFPDQKHFLLEPIDTVRLIRFKHFMSPEEQDAAIAEMEDQLGAAQESRLYRVGDTLDSAAQERFPVREALAQDRGIKGFFANDVPQGVGSMLAFMATATLGRGALQRAAPGMSGPAAGGVSASGLGSAVNAGAEFESALADGASLEEAYRIVDNAYKIGLAEGLPIFAFLDRLDKAAGGGVKKAVRDVLTQGTQEAIQEAGVEIANALNQYAVYNPDQDWWEVADETGRAGAVGFTTGSLLESFNKAALAMLPGKQRGRGTGAVEGAQEENTEVPALPPGAIRVPPAGPEQIGEPRPDAFEGQFPYQDYRDAEFETMEVSTAQDEEVSLEEEIRRLEAHIEEGKLLPPPTDIKVPPTGPEQVAGNANNALEGSFPYRQNLNENNVLQSEQTATQPEFTPAPAAVEPPAPEPQVDTKAAEPRPSRPPAEKPAATQPDTATQGTATEILERAAAKAKSLDELRSYANGRFGRDVAKQMRDQVDAAWNKVRGKRQTIVDETDLVERTKANIAGETPERASLIALADMLDAATDVMNDESLPADINQQAVDLENRIRVALKKGGDLSGIQKDAVTALKDWSGEDIGPAKEFAAIRQRIESQIKQLNKTKSPEGIGTEGPRGVDTQANETATSPTNDTPEATKTEAPEKPKSKLAQKFAEAREKKTNEKQTVKKQEQPTEYRVIERDDGVSSVEIEIRQRSLRTGRWETAGTFQNPEIVKQWFDSRGLAAPAAERKVWSASDKKYVNADKAKPKSKLAKKFEETRGKRAGVEKEVNSTQAQIMREQGKPLTDLRKKPTGWIEVPILDAGAPTSKVALIHPTENKTLTFENAAYAQAHAIDNPVDAKPAEQRELEVKPLFQKEKPQKSKLAQRAAEVRESKEALIRDFGEKIGGARKDISEKGVTRNKRKSAVEKSEIEKKPYHVDFRPVSADDMSDIKAFGGTVINDLKGKGKYIIIDVRKRGRPIQKPRAMLSFTYGQDRKFSDLLLVADSIEEANKLAAAAAVSKKHRVSLYRDGADYKARIERKVTDRKRWVIKDGFESREEAEKYLIQHAEKIYTAKTSFGEADLATIDDPERTGKQHRSGNRNVTDKEFYETFGFRGVEFGNWNNQAERQDFINRAYDALMDLAELIDVPPKALSLNGELALAFGSRGQGLTGSRAHYERHKMVINLTKLKGSGALAHEWMHALDAYFGRQDGKFSAEFKDQDDGTKAFDKTAATSERDVFISHGAGRQSKLRNEVSEAFSELMQDIFTHVEVDQTVHENLLRQEQKFLTEIGGNIERTLVEMREDIANKYPYGKRKVDPATKEQLAEFDRLANKITSGEAADVTSKRFGELTGNKKAFKWYLTNDTLDALARLYKDIRGRFPFSGDVGGNRYLDNVSRNLQMQKRREDSIAALKEASPEDSKKTTTTSFAREAHKLDQGRVADYWQTRQEMLARAFSAYIEDQLAAQGKQSDFLSYGSDNELLEYRLFGIKPFPEGEERARINKKFDNLFDTLETKETDQGIAFFNLADDASPGGMSVAGVKLVVNSFLKQMKGAADGLTIRVHQRQDQLLATLDIKNTRKIGRVKGAYSPRDNTFHIVAANMAGPQDVRHTLQHEILVHKGLGFLPLPERVRLIETIAENAPKSESLKQAWADIQRDYKGDSDYRKAEELLARMAERDLSKFDRFLNKIIQVIKDIFTKIGWMKPELSRQQLVEQVYRFADAFQRGERAGIRAPKELRMSKSKDDGNISRMADKKRGDRSSTTPQPQERSSVAEMAPKGSVGKVIVGATLYFSGDAHIFPDGSIKIRGIDERLRPGDKVYRLTSPYSKEGETYTTDREKAYKVASDGLDDGAGSGILETLIRANEKIDRNYTKNSPGFQKHDLMGTLDELFAPSFKDYRYKKIKETTTTNAEERAASEIDEEFGNRKPTNAELKKYFLEKQTDQLALGIGGFLHVDDGTAMTADLLSAIHAWRSLGGRIGKTALDAIAKYTGDYKASDQAAFVHDIPRTKRDGEVVELKNKNSNSKEEDQSPERSPRSQGAGTRKTGLTGEATKPIATFRKADDIKAHTDYRAAKAGDTNAAVRLIKDMVPDADYQRAAKRFGTDVTYVPVHAEEATGKNKLPGTLADAYAARAGGKADTDIIQTNRTFHTGAKAMDRLLSRPVFEGPVEAGAKYVVVDDVSTTGGTLAALADYIQSQGGEVVGSVLLANASRTLTMKPTSQQLQTLERRFGDEIRQLFQIEPQALTAAEAQYLIGFRNADELRNRATKARSERRERLGSKGIREDVDDFLFSKSDGLANAAGFSDWVPPNASLGTLSDPFLSQEGLKQRLRSIRRRLQDKHVVWQDVQKEIHRRGGSITDFSDAYNKFTLIEGKIGNKLKTVADDYVRPLVEELTETGITLEQLGEYLYAKFAPQRNARIAKINPEIPDGGSGMTNAEARAVLAKFSTKQTKQLESLAKKVYGMQRYKLDQLVDAGRITAELRAELLKDDRYVPLKGFSDPSELVTDTAAIGRGFDQAQDVFKRAKGRRSMAKELVATSIRDVEAALISAEKNRVGKSILKLVHDNPNKNIWEINPIKTQRTINSRTGQVETQVLKSYKALARDPNVFITWVKGNPYAIEFHDGQGGESSLARAVKNMGVDNVPWFVVPLARLNRYLSYVNTALSPEFMFTNPARDIQTALVKTLGDFDANTSALVVKNLPRALRAASHGLAESKLAKFVSKKAGLTQKEIEYFNEYLSEGAKTDYFRTKTVDEMKSELEAELHAAAKGVKGSAMRAFRALYRVVEHANGVLENTTRLSLYMVLREQGVSKHKAATAAKNATVNFNRRGESGAVLNSLYLFYNASLQGAHLTLRLLKNPKVQKLLVAAGAGMAVLTQYNILAGGDDEDGEPNYFKISRYDRERNLIIMWPDGSGRHWKFPLAYGLNVPLNAAAAAVHVANGRKPMEEALWVMASAWNSFSPVGEDGWNIISPTVTDPFVDISLNRNYADRPIMPDQNPFEKSPTPDSERAWPSTSLTYKVVAREVNKLTGGNEQLPGYVDISPESIQHLVETYTGAAGSFVNRVATWATDPDMEAYRKPFIRKIYGEKTEYATGTSYRENKAHIFYIDNRTKALSAKAGESQGDEKLFDEWLDNNEAGIALVKTLEQTEKRISKLYEDRRALQREDDTEDDIKQIEEDIRELQANFNSLYNEVYLDRGIAEKFQFLKPQQKQ